MIELRALYSNSLKSWDFGKAAPQHLCLERAIIAERQGASGDKNLAANPKRLKNNFFSCLGINPNGVLKGLFSAAASYSCAPFYNKYKKWTAKSREQKNSLKNIDYTINCINSFNYNITHPTQPTFTNLIGSGKVKLVYAGFTKVPLPADAAHVPPLTVSKIEDLAYFIPKNSFAGNELYREIRDGQSIKHEVYAANLQIFMESLGQNKRKAAVSSAILLSQFPTIEDLIKGFEKRDRRLHWFLEDNAPCSSDQYRKSFQRLAESCMHLAVDLADASHILIHGKPAIVAKIAQNNLEDEVRANRYPFPKSAHLALQLMKGFRELHASGYVHGDIKLDNILVYSFEGNPIVKIADWGKCKKLGSDEIGLHTGNRRHMAPERLSSQKGEVFGVAMMALRMLEEEFLTISPTQMLIAPAEKDPDKAQRLLYDNNPAKCRRGIERYLSCSKGCPEEDTRAIDAIPHVFASGMSLLLQQSHNIDAQVDKYLNELLHRLDTKYGVTPEKKLGIQNLISLLRAMMRSEKAKRITMEEAVPRLEASLLHLKNSPLIREEILRSGNERQVPCPNGLFWVR